MCPRRINGGILNPLITLNEITLEQFKEWFSVDFIKHLDSLFMCGNLGDPIIAQDCLEIFQYIKKINPIIQLSMHTNGSARSVQWWEQMAYTKVRVIFGIDGLVDTHRLYRIDTNYNKIIENATAFIKAGGHAEWHMLIFHHNEHQIDECQQLSQQMGFKYFQIKHTTRFVDGKFHVLNDQGKTTNILYPTEKSKQMTGKVTQYLSDVIPTIQCKAQKYKQIYVSADGTVSPCCWLDFNWILPKQDTRIDYMDKIGVFPNLNNTSLENVFASNFFNDIERTWTSDCLKECSKQCGSFDKLRAQFNGN
jgi:MoaA/NifB/PqqE/SkfB family radical SAM enzyme